MKLSYKNVPLRELKAKGDGSTFSGYCAVFHNCDGVGDIVLPGAFKETLPEFLASGQVLYDHFELIGKPTEASEDVKGLFVAAAISDTTRGRDTKTLLKDGVLRRMSIGYRTLGRRPASPDDVKAYWTSAGYTPTPEDLFNLQDNQNHLQFLTALKLYEASPVAFACNSQAEITAVKNGNGAEPLRLSQIKSLARRLRLDVKEGRVISKANRERLKAIHDHIEPALEDLKCLLKEAGQAEPDGDEGAGGDEKNNAPAAAALTKARATLALLASHPVCFVSDFSL